MFRISKLADYGVKILLAMAEPSRHLWTTAELAAATHLSLSIVSKILKLLNQAHLLESQRGSAGGYRLAKPLERISLAEVVGILDSDIAMTECEHHKGSCSVEPHCRVKKNWSVISKVIYQVLNGISLAQMQKPLLKPQELVLEFHRKKQVPA